MPAVRKRTLKALAGALVAAALVVAPLVTAGATAAEPFVGTVGTIEPATSKANGEMYWEERYAAYKAECFSHKPGDSTEHGSITDDGKTVTLSEFQDEWPGDTWVVLVVKGATSNNVIENPKAGTPYASPLTKADGPQADVSHWIVCKGTTPVTLPNAVVPTLEFGCDVIGYVKRSDNVNWTSDEDADGTITWIAQPKTGTVLQAGVQVSWDDVPSIEELTEECESDEQPEQPDPEQSESSKTVFDCATTTATTTTTTTTTEYVWDETTETWELGEPTSSDVTTDRPLTQAELGECPLVPGEIQSVCVGDVPYLGYQVTLPEGFVADSANPVTITFVNPDGEDYVVEGQPLSGALLWPGASDGEPKMWPGWDLVDGEYVQTDGNFAWTRAGVTVEFEVNPTYATEVEYPQATALCANPPVGGGDDPTTGTPTSTDAEALAVTGGGINPIVVAAGGSALLAGIAVVAIAAYRRRRAGMQ